MFKRRGEIVSVKDLFAKYKNTLVAPQKTVEMEVIRVVGEVVGITLTEAQVTYTVSTKAVTLRVSGMIKQEVRVKNKEVIAELQKRLGVKNAPSQIF